MFILQRISASSTAPIRHMHFQVRHKISDVNIIPESFGLAAPFGSTLFSMTQSVLASALQEIIKCHVAIIMI